MAGNKSDKPNPEGNHTELQRKKPALNESGDTSQDAAGRSRFDDLLARALDVPSSERVGFLQSNCDDLDLRRELMDLLGKEDELDGFLEQPAAVAVLADLGEQVCPEAIGPYRILEKLGVGGMGVVYLAEQYEPIERKLAVKVVRADLTVKGVRERFVAERRALARLSHPFIAQIYEAGSTEQGFPYFAMELVSGKPITAYCDSHRLSIEERLALFVQVCEGVQHAHQRGIIHRDLKPSNILVSEVEGRPVPKLIDFGIAKALDRPLTDITQLTGLGAVGTPAYMSPESLGLDGDEIDVDTRTDVYALGVVLYELLAGVRPFHLTGVSAAKIVRRLMSEDVPRPSARIAALDEEEQNAVASCRGLDAHSLPRRLAGDIDWITVRATARDRDQRYGSAAELAEDLERHLSFEPVSARPPSLSYRLGKLARRHRVATVAALVAMLALILGMAGLSLGLVRAQRAEAEARHAEAEARLEAETAKQIAEFLKELFRAPQGKRSLGETITAREILDKGAERIETELAGQTLIQGRLATVMGEVYFELGLFDPAKELLEKGLAWLREDLGEDHPEVADCLATLGGLENQLGNTERAVDLTREALAIRRKTLGNDHSSVASSLSWLATVMKRQGDDAAAESMWREGLAIRRRLGPDDSKTANILNNLGTLLARKPSRLAEAESDHQDALAIRRAVLEPRHPFIAHSLYNLGMVLMRRGKLESAEEYVREALAAIEKVNGDNHPITAQVRSGLAEILQRRGAVKEAEQLRRNALAIRRDAYGEESSVTAASMSALAETLVRSGTLDEAESLAREALALQRRVLQEGDIGIAEAGITLADCLTRIGKFAEAETHFLESFPRVLEVHGNDHVGTVKACNVGIALYEAWGNPEVAGRYRAILDQQPAADDG